MVDEGIKQRNSVKFNLRCFISSFSLSLSSHRDSSSFDEWENEQKLKRHPFHNWKSSRTLNRLSSYSLFIASPMIRNCDETRRRSEREKEETRSEARNTCRCESRSRARRRKMLLEISVIWQSTQHPAPINYVQLDDFLCPLFCRVVHSHRSSCNSIT